MDWLPHYRSLICDLYFLHWIEFTDRHKTRYHIGQLVKETSTKLKQATETDQRTEVSVSSHVIGILN